MKKLSALFSFLVLCISYTYSQSIAKFEWSKDLKVGKYSQAIFIFNHEGKYGTLIKYNSKVKNSVVRYSLHIYDSSLGLKFTSHFTLKRFKESVLDIWCFKGKLYMASQALLSNQRLSLRLRKFSLDTTHTSIKHEDLIVLENDHFSKNKSFSLIRNDSIIRIWHGNTLKSATDLLTITVMSYTFEMNQSDKIIMDLPVQSNLCKVYKIEPLIGDKFLLYTKQYFIRPLEKRGFMPNYNFVFYWVDSLSEVMHSVVLKNKNTFIDRCKIKITEDGFEAVGLFATKWEGPKTGVRVFKYDFGTSSIRLDSLCYFDKNAKGLMTNGYKTSLWKTSNFESFYLDYFVKIDRTKRLIIAEQYRTLPASLGSSYTYNRFYGDILLLYMNQEGEFYKAKRLLKAQETFNNFGEFSSYYIQREGLDFIFFYNSTFSKDSSRRVKPLIWHKQSHLLVSVVNEDKISTYSAATYKSVEGIIQVRDMHKLNAHSYLVYAYSRKKSKLGIMHLDELPVLRN